MIGTDFENPIFKLDESNKLFSVSDLLKNPDSLGPDYTSVA
jgi:hypothetical protein